MWRMKVELRPVGLKNLDLRLYGIICSLQTRVSYRSPSVTQKRFVQHIASFAFVHAQPRCVDDALSNLMSNQFLEHIMSLYKKLHDAKKNFPAETRTS